ncbi:MAG: hypothetical protein ABIG39_04455 [Candidatus Micrarchaeota archaeon]
MGFPKVNRDWPAIGERADRLVVLFLGLLVCAVSGTVVNGVDVLKATLVVVASMTLVGAVGRMVYAKRLIETFEGERKK